METEKNYFTVGLYIIGMVLLLAGFAIWLAGSSRADNILYRVYFSESVSGLTKGGAVKYRGVDVGTVENIQIDPRDPRRIEVEVRVLQSAPVTTKTTASLKLQGMTGAVFIELTGGGPQARLLRDVTPRGDIPVIPSEVSGIAAVVNQLPVIMEKLSRFADQMNKLASDENVDSLNMLLGNTTSISSDVRDIVRNSKQDSKEITVNLRKASRDINEVTETVKDNPSALLFPPDEKGIPAP